MPCFKTSVGHSVLSHLIYGSPSAIGAIRSTDPAFRAVVFSQFTTFLDLIQLVLDRERLIWYRFDGTMDVKKRSEAISGFKESSDRPKVLIVSLKAGGVGLNVGRFFASYACIAEVRWLVADERESCLHGVYSCQWLLSVLLTYFADGLLVELGDRESSYRSRAQDRPGTNGLRQALHRACSIFMLFMRSTTFLRFRTRSNVGSSKYKSARPRSSRRPLEARVTRTA